MNVLWETMIGEMRAQRAELDNRRHFTEEKKPIIDSRTLIDEWLAPGPTVDAEAVALNNAKNMQLAADNDLFELG